MKAVNKAIERIKSKTHLYSAQPASQDAESSFIFIKEDKVSYNVDVNKIFYIEAVVIILKYLRLKKYF